jgi:hypothetical protein
MQAAKEFMPYFLKAGVWESNSKDGLPLRKLLRDLDKSNQLHLIPYLVVERKAKNVNWFFRPLGRSDRPTPLTNKKPISKEKIATKTTVQKSSARAESDENYVISLCDEVLSKTGSRQHTFDFLRGDAGNNRQGKKLPVDAFYESLNLVIEYRERQHSEAVPHFDKPDVMTVSGVSRGEQRKIYDQRRRDVLKEQKIKLIEIDYSMFNFNSSKKVIRNKGVDLGVVRKILKK